MLQIISVTRGPVSDCFNLKMLRVQNILYLFAFILFFSGFHSQVQQNKKIIEADDTLGLSAILGEDNTDNVIVLYYNKCKSLWL